MITSDAIARMQNQTARHFQGSTVTVTTPGITSFNSDLSVTLSGVSSFTVNCHYPRAFRADDKSGIPILTGDCFTLLDRSDTLITFDPQPGMQADIEGEQYRIEWVDYLPGAIRLHLRGGAAEGTGGA